MPPERSWAVSDSLACVLSWLPIASSLSLGYMTGEILEHFHKYAYHPSPAEPRGLSPNFLLLADYKSRTPRHLVSKPLHDKYVLLGHSHTSWPFVDADSEPHVPELYLDATTPTHDSSSTVFLGAPRTTYGPIPPFVLDALASIYVWPPPPSLYSRLCISSHYCEPFRDS
jgi:hypothetical protein